MMRRATVSERVACSLFDTRMRSPMTNERSIDVLGLMVLAAMRSIVR